MLTEPLPIDCQILLRIVCTNLWLVSHTSFLLMEKGRFLYALLHDDSIDLLTFICQQILHTFKVPGHRIGLLYVCLIHQLVTSLWAAFPYGVSRWACRPNGHTTISQSQFHAPYLLLLVNQLNLLIRQCQLTLLVIFYMVSL